jgi:hypothetical protein
MKREIIVRNKRSLKNKTSNKDVTNNAVNDI